MNFQPIETHYAGCRFRSRLEARYAVLFDKLDIRWMYEPQGFDIRGTWYLADFYLPEHKLWVEVKGTDEGLDFPLLVNAAIPHWGLPLDPDGAPVPDASRVGFRLLVLGPIPHVRSDPGHFEHQPDVPVWTWPTHTALHFWKGDVTSGFASFTRRRHIDLLEGGFVLGDDAGAVTTLDDGQYPSLANTGGAIWDKPIGDADAVAAYTAARSARFEHGESG